MLKKSLLITICFTFLAQASAQVSPTPVHDYADPQDPVVPNDQDLRLPNNGTPPGLSQVWATSETGNITITTTGTATATYTGENFYISEMGVNYHNSCGAVDFFENETGGSISLIGSMPMPSAEWELLGSATASGNSSSIDLAGSSYGLVRAGSFHYVDISGTGGVTVEVDYEINALNSLNTNSGGAHGLAWAEIRRNGVDEYAEDEILGTPLGIAIAGSLTMTFEADGPEEIKIVAVTESTASASWQGCD